MGTSIIATTGRYIQYLAKAKTSHSIHSPFVFDLVTKVLNNKQSNQDMLQIHSCFLEQKRSRRVLETTDFGAMQGNRSYVTRFQTVSEIARKSSVNKQSGELLYRLVEYFKPGVILELGTSLGISTLYLAKAAPGSKVFTLEGCAAKVEVAKANFQKMGVQNIEVSTGRFDTQLPLVCDRAGTIDFAFLDGHHQYKPTLEYFRKVRMHSTDETVIVLDDIHWSSDMEKAWGEICRSPEVSVSIDLFSLGIVFFRKSLSKQHFILRW